MANHRYIPGITMILAIGILGTAWAWSLAPPPGPRLDSQSDSVLSSSTGERSAKIQDDLGPDRMMAPILDPASSRLSVQALLLDAIGDPLPGPTVNLVFNLYDSLGSVVEGPIVLNNVPVNNGVVHVLVPVSRSSFDGTEREMGISVNGNPELSPRIMLSAVPYAFRVDRVASEELDDVLDLGAVDNDGELRLFSDTANARTILLQGRTHSLFIAGSDGTANVRLDGEPYGELTLRDEIGDQQTVTLSATSDGGGQLTLRDATGIDQVILDGENSSGGGIVTIGDTSGSATIELIGAETNSTGGIIQVSDSDSAVRVSIDGESENTGGEVSIFDNNGNETIELLGAQTSSTGGVIRVSNTASQVRVAIDGEGANGAGEIRVFNNNDVEVVEIRGDESGDVGQILLRNSTGDADMIEIDAEGNTDPNQTARIRIFQNDANAGVTLEGNATDGGSSGHGKIRVFDADGNVGVALKGATAEGEGGEIQIRNASGSLRLTMDGDSVGDAGEISVFNGNGVETVQILADQANNAPQIMLKNNAATNRIELHAEGSVGARIQVFQDDGTSGIALEGQHVDSGSQMRMFANDGDLSVYLLANSVAGGTQGAGRILLYDKNGAASVFIDGDYNNTGMGRLRADIIRVQGGVDLAEPFACKDKAAVQPGMVMSIDRNSPGGLMIATEAYDRKVAGIVSGAGGVQPGIMLTQEGVIDGDHPIALTGRVYCWCDASFGAIEPGDMLTTSNTPAHAMKVTDYTKSQGATIGKAMTALAEGKGLVLVLVQPQ